MTVRLKISRLLIKVNAMNIDNSKKSKMVLIISVASNLFLLIPLWGHGVLFGGAFWLLISAIIFKTEIPKAECKRYLTLALILCSAFAVNCYNSLAVSRSIEYVSSLIHIGQSSLSFGMVAVAVAMALPMASSLLYYSVETFRQGLASSKESDGEGYIGFSKGACFIFGIYILALSALFRANFFYQDDIGRSFYGYKQWDYFGRFVSTAFSSWIHMGNILLDASPLPQIIAAAELSIAGILVLYVILRRTKFTLTELFAVVPLGLNPFFMECLLFRFDAPYMAFSILAGVLPLLFLSCSCLGYMVACALSTVAICCSYQASLGVLPMLVLVLCLRMWCNGEQTKVLRFALRSVCGYALGLLFFTTALMRPINAGYVSNTPFGFGEMIPGVLRNLKIYYSTITANCSPIWKCAAGVLILAAVARQFMGSRRNKYAALAMSVLTIACMAVVCFGLYPALTATLYSFRAIYGFAVLVVLLSVVAVEGNCSHIIRFCSIALTWSMVVFALNFGNAASAQQKYVNLRYQSVISDLSEMYAFTENREVSVCVCGSPGFAPEVMQMIESQKAVKPLLADGGWNGEYKAFEYSGLPNIVRAETPFNDLPVYKETAFYTIYADETHVNVQFK